MSRRRRPLVTPDQPSDPGRWMPLHPAWPLWAAILFSFLTMFILLLAFGVAVQGRVSWAVAGVAAATGCVTSFWGDREYWRLDPADRVRVWRATRTGRPTGAPELDAIVLDRLQKATRSPRGDRIMVEVVLAFFTAVPIVAAIRQSAWWLCALVLVVIWLPALKAQRLAIPRAERLLTFTSGQQDGSA